MIAAKNIALSDHRKDEKTMDEKEKIMREVTEDGADINGGKSLAASLDSRETEEREKRVWNLRMKLRQLPMTAMRLIAEYRKNAKQHALDRKSVV